ncbi:MAG TPA: DUF3078 domain-containing protein [Chitinophagaceae bacterium]|nr:DUF3078 domain-containing protein [Chitinophagaceae bacterium]
MKLLFVLACLCIAHAGCAQEELLDLKRMSSRKKATPTDSLDWKHTGMFIVNLSQSTQSNWGVGGEKFMFGVNSIFNRSIHHRKGKYFFDAYADVEIGLVYATSYGEFRKTSDRFDFTADLEHTIDDSDHYSYGLLVNINTQLFPGKDYVSTFHEKISNFLTPGKALISAGVEYREVTPKLYFTAFLSPATVRWVTKLDEDFYAQKRFGVDSLKKVFTELGPYLSLHAQFRFTKQLSFQSRLDLFGNYRKPVSEVDFLMNNIASISFNKWLAATVLVDLLYDHDTKSALQLQQISGIGLKLNL